LLQATKYGGTRRAIEALKELAQANVDGLARLTMNEVIAGEKKVEVRSAGEKVCHL
jgi:hypothetical protein